MPLEAPKLDSRTFEELLRETQLRIPRYTPEWTDFNESDPGTTLVQLFVWLTEMMLYQMNRVPERNYIKFLKLFNQELRPAQPADAHLTFTAQAGAEVESVRAGAQIMAQSPAGGEPLVFETESGLDLIRVPLSNVRVFDGVGFTDATPLNEATAATFRPLGWTPQIGNALYLGFQPTEPPHVGRAFPQEIRLRVFLPATAQAGRPQKCEVDSQSRPRLRQDKSALLEPAVRAVEEATIARYIRPDQQATAQQRIREALSRALGWEVGLPAEPPLSLVWEYKPSDEAQRWSRLNVYADETQNFTREGYILLEGPAKIAPTVAARIEEHRFWLRCRLAAGSYPAGRAPEVDFIRPNTVPAMQLSTVREEIVGISEGTPDQSFSLRYKPVQPESLDLWVEEPGPPPKDWQPVEDFLRSGRDDKHYILDATTGQIRFGDGRCGRIPVADAEVIARRYRYGGGAAGNVGVGLINAPLTALVGVEQVTNERPAVGGRDEQSVEEFKEQAPGLLRSRNRAVTAEDFAALALQAGNIAKATAIPLAHPEHPGVEVPGAVTVVIVPDTEDIPPQPSQDLIQHVCEYLNGYRLLTTEIYVKGPIYQAIRVEARVAARPYEAFDEVSRQVSQALNEYLDPLGRSKSKPTANGNGADQAERIDTVQSQRGYKFGQELYPTNLYGVIQDVDGVAAVLHLTVTVNGRPHDNLTQPVIVPLDGLVYGADHEIIVEPSQDR